jgi:hypothetical protein
MSKPFVSLASARTNATTMTTTSSSTSSATAATKYSRRKQLFLGASSYASSSLLLSKLLKTRREGDEVDVAFAAAGEEEEEEKYKPFQGKASNAFTFEVPTDWVVAIDRQVEESNKRKKPETKVVVGQFKTVDTISVRMEIADASVKEAFALAEEKKDANYIEREFTKEEREAAAGKIAQDVIVGVENNRSGVMKFINVGDENEKTTRRIERDGKAYYMFQSISEVCRAEITEIGGGKKICIGPRGDEIDTIERRAMTLVTVPDANDGSYFVVKMSAKVDRWEETKEKFEHAAETFRML